MSQFEDYDPDDYRNTNIYDDFEQYNPNSIGTADYTSSSSSSSSVSVEVYTPEEDTTTTYYDYTDYEDTYTTDTGYAITIYYDSDTGVVYYSNPYTEDEYDSANYYSYYYWESEDVGYSVTSDQETEIQYITYEAGWFEKCEYDENGEVVCEKDMWLISIMFLSFTFLTLTVCFIIKVCFDEKSSKKKKTGGDQENVFNMAAQQELDKMGKANGDVQFVGEGIPHMQTNQHPQEMHVMGQIPFSPNNNHGNVGLSVPLQKPKYLNPLDKGYVEGVEQQLGLQPMH